MSKQEAVDPQPAMHLEGVATRPRLVFFRLLERKLPAFVNSTLDDHVHCLRHFFDVFVVTENCNYDQVCNRLRPDLSLFESGVYVRPDRRISDTHRHPQIPKLGLIDADAYCLTRSVFLSDMDEWGVEQFFTISMSLPDRVPHLRDRLFVWPNFADSRRFRTYPGEKATRILLAGSHASNYPWRSRVNRLLRDAFDVDSIPHGGWLKAKETTGMLVGEGYARALSASLIIPTCGTIAHELVRKHLEIPASGALLLTERTPAVEAAGFVDMENCVFADEANVVDKTRLLLDNPHLIERISAAGQRLAHAQHDLVHRDQILQWYNLTKSANPGQVVMQTDPFGRMTLGPRRDGLSRTAEIVVGRDRASIRAADKAVREGRVHEARSILLATSNFHYQSEIALGLARLLLQEGDAVGAREWIWDSIYRCTRGHGAASPDPIEWSVYILSLLCAGKLQRAVWAVQCYPGITNSELARMRQLVQLLTGKDSVGSARRNRLSIHQERALPWSAWVADVAQTLTRCGQLALAQKVAGLQSEAEPTDEAGLDVDVSEPRKVGRRPWSLRYRRPLPRLGIRSRLERMGYWPSRVVAKNPFVELLEGRALQTMIVTGFSPDDPIAAQAREACRRSPEPCTLVTIGDLPSRSAPAGGILNRGSDALFGPTNPPLAAATGNAVVVAPASFDFVRDCAYFGARTVALTGVSQARNSLLVCELDTSAEWRRARLPTSNWDHDIAAWERAI